MEIDFSYANLSRERVIEWARLPSGRIVAMTEEESFWFESDGQSPKGSFLTPWPPLRAGAGEGARGMNWNYVYPIGLFVFVIIVLVTAAIDDERNRRRKMGVQKEKHDV